MAPLFFLQKNSSLLTTWLKLKLKFKTALGQRNTRKTEIKRNSTFVIRCSLLKSWVFSDYNYFIITKFITRKTTMQPLYICDFVDVFLCYTRYCLCRKTGVVFLGESEQLKCSSAWPLPIDACEYVTCAFAYRDKHRNGWTPSPLTGQRRVSPYSPEIPISGGIAYMHGQKQLPLTSSSSPC